MKLELECVEEFGQARFYSRDNCKDADLILSLMGRKSFTAEQVKLMRGHGWEIDYQMRKIVV